MPRNRDIAETVRLSAIEEDILTVLVDRECYGLEILGYLNLERRHQLTFGSLYPALNRLGEKKFIDWRWGDETENSGGARRKYYKMLDLGIATLEEVQNYREGLKRRES
jgi:PadR family transcriptional regulator, regulatory protein PadR